MVEADIYVVFGLAFAAFVSLGSMDMFWFLEVGMLSLAASCSLFMVRKHDVLFKHRCDPTGSG